nr:MAG TPA: hypothetical protein [Caudoviricetes sp.]
MEQFMDLKTRINELESLVTTKLLCERTFDFTKRRGAIYGSED